jgi:hypothetical protein
MRQQLKAAVERNWLTNITVLATTWQMAPAQIHDIVLASHVLYTIEDIAAFLLKLDRCARRACYIVTRVDPLGAPIADLWRQVWQTEPPPEPSHLDLMNVLFALGIRPSAQLMTLDPAGRFQDLDDAVDFVRRQLFLTDVDEDRDSRIRSSLEATLVPVGSRLTWPTPQQAAIVGWTTPV